MVARAQPGRRPNPAMAYDVARERVVRFDAQGIWEWDGARWSSRNDAVGPSPRTFSAAAYDLARCSMVMFSGLDPSSTAVDTWEWDGASWAWRNVSPQPPARWDHAMAYDTARRRTVVFGGCTATAGLLADTWEWDGTTWRSLIAAGPIARHAHALAYDLARQRTVLFGGEDSSRVLLGDTWEWDGASWTQRLTATNPSARHGSEMAYDALRQRIVMYGGGGNGVAATDTWELDGTDWILRTPAPIPAHVWSTRSPSISPAAASCCSAAPRCSTPGNGTAPIGRESISSRTRHRGPTSDGVRSPAAVRGVVRRRAGRRPLGGDLGVERCRLDAADATGRCTGARRPRDGVRWQSRRSPALRRRG